MQRNDDATSVASLPTPAVTVNPGYFTDGNPATSTPATIVQADWANGITEELLSILTAAGITPDKTNNGQVLAAIQSLTRVKLVANATIYVAPSGSDSNPGTSGSPFLTLQKAWNHVIRDLDLNGHNVTINVADGTYAPVLCYGTP